MVCKINAQAYDTIEPHPFFMNSSRHDHIFNLIIHSCHNIVMPDIYKSGQYFVGSIVIVVQSYAPWNLIRVGKIVQLGGSGMRLVKNVFHIVVVYYSGEITGCTACTQLQKLRCTAKFLGAPCTRAPANFEPWLQGTHSTECASDFFIFYLFF